MNLPQSHNLPTQKLASVFSSTSATYKFYWLIALIELVEDGNIEISKRKILHTSFYKAFESLSYAREISDHIPIVLEFNLN